MQLLKSIPKALLAGWFWRHQVSAATKTCIVLAFQVLGVTANQQVVSCWASHSGACACRQISAYLELSLREFAPRNESNERSGDARLEQYLDISLSRGERLPCLSLVRIPRCESARTLPERVRRKRREGARVWPGLSKRGEDAED
jgi:hypothetical protein